MLFCHYALQCCKKQKHKKNTGHHSCCSLQPWRFVVVTKNIKPFCVPFLSTHDIVINPFMKLMRPFLEFTKDSKKATFLLLWFPGCHENDTQIPKHHHDRFYGLHSNCWSSHVSVIANSIAMFD